MAHRKNLIELFTKPLPKNRKLRRADRGTHPQKWDAFIEYAKLDVDATRSVSGLLPSWNRTPAERALRRLDQRVDDSRFRVDVELA